MPYLSTKTYGHELGISCAFRQWRANSHCRFLHGYALSFSFVFTADGLDSRNWIMDFGALKALKQALQDTFDHKIVIAEDDPEKDTLCSLGGLGIGDPIVLPGVGCELFAAYAWRMASDIIKDLNPNVRVLSCEVREHGANSAIYKAEAYES